MVKLSDLSIKKIAAAMVGLLIVVGGGAYYYYEYLPQTEGAATVTVHQAVKSPASTKPAKPAAAQQSPAASAVPAVVTPQPVAPVPVQSVIAAPSNVAMVAAVPVLEPAVKATSESVKPKPVVKKSVRKKTRVKQPPVQTIGVDSEPAVPVSSQQLTSPLPAVLPDSGVTNEPAVVAKLDAPKYNDLLTAVLRSDKDAVKQLLDFGRWVDKPGASGTTPLLAAVMNEDAKMVQLLLEHGAVPSAEALKLARKNKDAATVLLLEQHGAR